MSGDSCKVCSDGLLYYGNSHKGEAPFWSEALNGYSHGLRGSIGNSPAQGDARMHKGLSFQHGICNRDHLLNRP